MTSFAVALTCTLASAVPAAGAAAAPLFPVVQDGKWGYADRAGRLAVTPRFDAASRFQEGLASVRLGRQLGYADAAGKIVLVPEAEPAGGALHRPFSGGRAAVSKGGRLGFIDRTGRLAIAARWLSAEDFSEGRALACDEAGCGFLDAEGRYAPVAGAMGGTPFRNGIASIVLAMGMSHRRTQFLSLERGLLPGEYEGNGSFSEGLAPVRFGGLWGYVDRAGAPAIRNAFEDAGDFSEGLAAVTVRETGRCGYVERGGRLAIPARFAVCHPFAGGLARVDLSVGPVDAERVAFVDREGTVRIRGDQASPPFRAAADFADGLAAVADGPIELAGDGAVRLGYIDATGRYVWPMKR